MIQVCQQVEQSRIVEAIEYVGAATLTLDDPGFAQAT